jgi:uncharacterized protein YdeI (YjbR/CyaY-like superfamily)
MATFEDLEVVDAADRAAWRSWLAANHASAPGALLVLARRRGAPLALTYDEAVEEALCFGWIDGRQVPFDEAVIRQHFAPRRPGGTWARSNKERVERLEREGRMTDAGRRVIEAARRDGAWAALDEIDALVIPPDLAEAFVANAAGSAAFSSFSPSVRRGFLWWIKSAKRPETRRQRIADTVWLAEHGIKVPGRRP